MPSNGSSWMRSGGAEKLFAENAVDRINIHPFLIFASCFSLIINELEQQIKIVYINAFCSFYYNIKNFIIPPPMHNNIGGGSPCIRHASTSSQLRKLRESDPKLAEDEPREDRTKDSAESAENVTVLLLRRHEVDRGLNRVVACGVVFGHESLLVVFEVCLSLNEAGQLCLRLG